MKVIWLCLLLSAFLFSEAKESYHHRIDEEVALVEKAENRLQAFNKQMDDYLKLRETSREESAPLLKKIGEWEMLTKGDAAFKEAVEQLRVNFLAFRESLSHCVAQSDHYSPHACTLRAMSILDLTNWYTSYIESLVLPEKRDTDQNKN